MALTKADRERDKDLAMFVAVLGMAPSEYWQLTMNQRNEIIKAWNASHKK